MQSKSIDNLPAHQVEEIKPLIEGVGASVVYLSPYSPEFNPIEHWWSQLKANSKTIFSQECICR